MAKLLFDDPPKKQPGKYQLPDIIPIPVDMPPRPTGKPGDYITIDGMKTDGRKLKEVNGLIVHHTVTPNSTRPEKIINDLNEQDLSIQYIMDGEGKVYQVLPDGMRASHIKPSKNGVDLSNSNTIGIEVAAENDKGINDAQKKAMPGFIDDMRVKHPSIGANVWGHGELKTGKQPDEGKTLTEAWRNLNQVNGPDLRRDKGAANETAHKALHFSKYDMYAAPYTRPEAPRGPDDWPRLRKIVPAVPSKPPASRGMAPINPPDKQQTNNQAEQDRLMAKLLGRQQQQPSGSLSALLGHAPQGQSAGILAGHPRLNNKHSYASNAE